MRGIFFSVFLYQSIFYEDFSEMMPLALLGVWVIASSQCGQHGTTMLYRDKDDYDDDDDDEEKNDTL